MKDQTVRSVDEYVAAVKRISKKWDSDASYVSPWFRGVGHASFKLQPRLYRACEGSPSRQEPNIRVTFANRALPYFPGSQDRNEWDWYFLMQHYSVPTRLLDWTESALVGLYFALYSWQLTVSKPHPLMQPAVWMLNPHELNGISIQEPTIIAPSDSDLADYLPRQCDGPITGKLPIAIYPRYIDPRMTAQHSTFTLHGNVESPLEDAQELKELLAKDHLVRILIAATDKRAIDSLKLDLNMLGMRNSTVFPGLDGLAKDICEDYTSS